MNRRRRKGISLPYFYVGSNHGFPMPISGEEWERGEPELTEPEYMRQLFRTKYPAAYTIEEILDLMLKHSNSSEGSDSEREASNTTYNYTFLMVENLVMFGELECRSVVVDGEEEVYYRAIME